jgi:hypothetical protein
MAIGGRRQLNCIQGYNDNNSNDENEKKVMPCVARHYSMAVLFTGSSWLMLYLTASQNDEGFNPSDAQNIALPAADELVDPPVKKLAEAEEPAEPRSVDAPVLDADCAYAGAAKVDIANPVARIADMIANILVALFMVTLDYLRKLFNSCSTFS